MYDKKDLFASRFQSKAEELAALCTQSGVPCFMTFCVYDDGRHTEYKNYISGSASNGIRLAEDHICNHVNVANGFRTVAPYDDFDEEAYMND